MPPEYSPDDLALQLVDRLPRALDDLKIVLAARARGEIREARFIGCMSRLNAAVSELALLVVTGGESPQDGHVV